MDPDHDASSTDEYFMTAVQIFDYCGGQSSGTIRVDTLMDKFAPFVKTDNSEFGFLKSLLDPDQSNPEVSVGRLARALSLYSDRQKANVDLEESFNLKSGPMPQDSDSGISTDGFQLLEDLQSELREKAHLTLQLRGQLEFSDRQHEEVVAALTAERDTLRAHLNMLREENATLTDVKRDYDEACDRLSACETALDEARRELEYHKKRTRIMDDRIQVLETEKLDLQELLAKSRAECHRINEMYASRQSVLLEENETLKTEHADLFTKMQDHEIFVQQLIREKVHLEMELRDVLNKSNQTQQRLAHSIDVSYTDDQMLSALDTITADTRFVQEHLLLDEEAFKKALKEDQGRMTNLSLFDEIRLSISSTPLQGLPLDEYDNTDDNESGPRDVDTVDTSKITTETQTEVCVDTENKHLQTETKKKMIDVAIQTDVTKPRSRVHEIANRFSDLASHHNFDSKAVQTKYAESERSTQITDVIVLETKETQTSDEAVSEKNNNDPCKDCSKCLECEKRKKYTKNLENDLLKSQSTMAELRESLDKYELNLDMLEKYLDDGSEQNARATTSLVQSLQAKLAYFDVVCANQRENVNSAAMVCDNIEKCCVECQTTIDHMSVGTQVEVPCRDCTGKNVSQHRGLRRYLWEPLKSLFQMFAVICFLCAISVLYSLSSRSRARCREVPWRWLDAHEFIDMLLQIDYGGDVPM